MSPYGILSGNWKERKLVSGQRHRRDGAGTYLGGYTGCAEQAGILVHIKRRAADGIWLEHACAEVMDETDGRKDK